MGHSAGRLLAVAPVVFAIWSTATASQSLRVDDIVDRAMRYTGDFLNRFSSVVAEEQYVQKTTMPHRRRQLTSDFLLVKPPELVEWFQFRDVFEVDGRPVHDRDERLGALFLRPGADAIARAVAIGNESARYNLEDMGNINKPLSAMSILQDRYRNRFRFSLGRREKQLGPDVWLVNFQEQAVPTVFRSDEANRDLPARGSMWIEESTGRIVKTEIWLGGRNQIVTTFRFDESLQINVPSEMRDLHEFKNDNLLTGVATYGRFRRFTVRTEESFR